MQHVIVGAGPAGVVAAETLRKGDRAADIVLIGDEPEAPYSRMAIPYVLEGMIAESGTHLRKTDGHYEGHGIQYRQGRAESVAPADGTLTLTGGERVSYDRLLLSTGATPLSPPVPGLDLPGVYNCWTLEDCRKIAALLNDDANVVLIGAGFIGCIIMEALAKRCGTLAVVEMEDRMVSRMMDATASGMLQRWCAAKEIRVLTSARVTGIEAQEGAADHGVLVDQHLETSAKGVFAAGDVAQGLDFSTGEYSVHAIQPTATEHGRIAALNMLGRQAYYKGSLNMNVLATVGLVSSSFGSWDGVGGDSGVAVDEDGYKYLRLEFDGDQLIGALGLGLTEHVGVIRGLIQNKTALADWKEKLLENPHRVMEAYVAHSQT